ncbi:hypothetical protein SSP35_35_00180 [Streptomyces sp. NBRC 110611]|uniref:hypothetical protein n=1 Tax=Streptomyces sp. NBRC 110611 TaxID=1621259 RepID=UPI00082F6F5F|nr:hypothetical protein [Streptomyces sp. NBRC 110611]GAU71350.1 hypothetical protein SSP35_35_00180 [Streptomyces sp. NBRC 110611]
MPATLIDEPLGLTCVFSDGKRATFSLDGLPNPHLARDLALGLAELVHPHGTVDAAGSVMHYVSSARHLVRTLSGRGFSGGAGQLSRGMLAEYWMGTSMGREAHTRHMILGFAANGGALAPGVEELANGRNYNPQPYRKALPPYGEVEWDRLTTVCRTLVEESYAAHRRALAAVARGRHPTEGGWTAENFCWLLSRTGPIGTPDFAGAIGVSFDAFHRRGAGGFHDAVQSVFPHLDVTIAYRLLFGVYSGIVPDGIDGLGVGDIDWAGDASILLSYVKGRTAAESLNLPRRAVRLLEQWLAHSALLRSFMPPGERERLWLCLARPGNAALAAPKITSVSRLRWARLHGIVGADGKPLKIHRARIRTTHHAMRDKRTWTGSGRATIDPNHSPAVEGDHYLTATTPAQRKAVEAIVEDAQHDLLRRAHPPVILTVEDAAALAKDYPELVAAMDLDDAVLAELIGGQRDVFTAACGDQLSGLHGPKGKPCPARPWVCLLCPLAVFAPRHTVNLLRLKAFFSRQWQQMPVAQFMAVFGPYATRIQQVLDRFDPALLAEAASRVGDTDEELPLQPEELTA